jgi:hypothetical protein
MWAIGLLTNNAFAHKGYHNISLARPLVFGLTIQSTFWDSIPEQTCVAFCLFRDFLGQVALMASKKFATRAP